MTLVSEILGSEHTLVTEPQTTDLENAVGAIVRAHFTVDEALFDAMPRLQVLARTGVGTERIDLAAASRRGIPVVITPGSNTNAVAECAVALGLALIKRVQFMHSVVQSGDWRRRDDQVPMDIDGAIVGIVGWGRIGQRLGSILEAMGASVRVYDPYAVIPSKYAVESLDALLKQSHFVSLHVPLTESTRHIFNAESFATMRPGAVLVNCSRGPLIDLDAALDALNNGTLAGLGLDVFDQEPPAPHQIFEHPNVLLSPHVAGLSARASQQTFHDAAQGIVDVLAGRQPAAVAREVMG
ncbi:MAG: NAD(P)-dependent oxidoreductase [Microbacteriaceae bacterium]